MLELEHFYHQPELDYATQSLKIARGFDIQYSSHVSEVFAERLLAKLFFYSSTDGNDSQINSFSHFITENFTKLDPTKPWIDESYTDQKR